MISKQGSLMCVQGSSKATESPKKLKANKLRGPGDTTTGHAGIEQWAKTSFHLEIRDKDRILECMGELGVQTLHEHAELPRT